MTAGEALRGVLAVVGMKQVDLARRSNTSGKHINMIINGNARITPDVAVAVADAIAEHLCALDTAGALARARRDHRSADIEGDPS